MCSVSSRVATLHIGQFGSRHDVQRRNCWCAYIVAGSYSCACFAGMMIPYPSRCTMLVKKELLFLGPFGPSAWLAGIVFIDRLNHDKARETMENTAKHMIKENVSHHITLIQRSSGLKSRVY